MKFEKTFGESIKKLREEKRLPLREVAEALGIDTSMLGKIEKNSRRPTKELINKIADYFKVSDENLLVAFVSDKVAYEVLEEEELSSEIFKVAEEKVKYLKVKNKS